MDVFHSGPPRAAGNKKPYIAPTFATMDYPKGSEHDKTRRYKMNSEICRFTFPSCPIFFVELGYRKTVKLYL